MVAALILSNVIVAKLLERFGHRGDHRRISFHLFYRRFDNRLEHTLDQACDKSRKIDLLHQKTGNLGALTRRAALKLAFADLAYCFTCPSIILLLRPGIIERAGKRCTNSTLDHISGYALRSHQIIRDQCGIACDLLLLGSGQLREGRRLRKKVLDGLTNFRSGRGQSGRFLMRLGSCVHGEYPFARGIKPKRAGVLRWPRAMLARALQTLLGADKGSRGVAYSCWCKR